MKKFLQIIGVFTLASSILSLSGFAQASTASSKTKSAVKANKTEPTPKVVDEDDMEPDIQKSKNFEYKCELGNSLTIYTNAEDDLHAAMRWKKQIYRMTRIETSTGANRFENRKAGLVFISIPAKGLLLDSHKGKQLANECKTTEPAVADTQAITEPSPPAK